MPGLRSVPDAPPRAWIYVRQSVEREESVSLELQETACRDFCARQGYAVVEVVADPGISGRTWKRPGVTRVMDAVVAGEADVIVLWRWSRLSRRRLDWAVAVDKVESLGGRIESATEPVDTSTASGRLARGMLAEIAAWESERIGEQWKEAHERRRRAGLPHHGRPRLGYTYDRATGYSIDPDTAPLVVELHRRHIAGEGLYKVAEWLTSVGIPITHRGVSYYLRSGFAAGLLRRHDPACGCNDPANCSASAYTRGAHEPIIDETTWRRLQAEMNRRSTGPRRLTSAASPMSGLVRCASCGYGMRLRSDAHYGKGYIYACTVRECTAPPSATRARVEAAVKEWLAGIAEDVAVAAAAAAAESSTRSVEKIERQRLAREVGRLDATLVRLTRDLASGLVPEIAYRTARDELMGERVVAASRLGELEAVSARPRPTAGSARALLTDWDTLPTAQLNLALRGLCQVVIARAARGRPTLRVIGVWEATPNA